MRTCRSRPATAGPDRLPGPGRTPGIRDLSLVVRAFAPDSTEIGYRGPDDPHVPISQGWLRASHRALGPAQSRPFLPVHPHDRTEPLTPGAVYGVDIEILPTSLTLPAG